MTASFGGGLDGEAVWQAEIQRRSWAGSRDGVAARADAVRLGTCEELLAGHLAAAAWRFGSAALGLVDLPALGPEPIVPAQLQVAAVLYWCRELEAAGMPSFIEVLAVRLSQGELVVDLGGAAQRLAAVWRQRQLRFGEGERRSLYARLFGEPGGAADIDASLRELALALAEVGRRRADQGVSDLQARIATRGGDLARTLSEKATGIAGFAAREIVAQIREALALLRHPDLARALGGGAPWTILSRSAPDVLRRPIDVNRRVGRALAGLELLRWLARRGAVPSAGAAPGRRDPIIGAAESWLATFAEAV